MGVYLFSDAAAYISGAKFVSEDVFKRYEQLDVLSSSSSRSSTVVLNTSQVSLVLCWLSLGPPALIPPSFLLRPMAALSHVLARPPRSQGAHHWLQGKSLSLPDPLCMLNASSLQL